MPDDAPDDMTALARAALDLANTLYMDAHGTDLWNIYQREPADPPYEGGRRAVVQG